MTYHDYDCECNDCDSSKWIYVGDIVKFKPSKTSASKKLIWYGLVTEQGNDSSKMKWVDPTYWMNMNRWVHTSRLEKMSVPKR